MGDGGPTRVAIFGATGRMGRALMRAAAAMPRACIVSAVASPGSAHLGADAGELAGVGPAGVRIGCDPHAALADADVAIDFSAPESLTGHLAACVTARKPLLIGTTGFAASLASELESAAKQIPLLVAPNTSLGVTVLLELVKQAASALPGDFDIEIIEAHHRAKRDAPSGTALALGRAAAESRGESLGRVGIAPGDRQGARREGAIGFAVVRGGDIVGEHTVLFAGAGEQLALEHRATDRSIFARGALTAALWLAGRAPGSYSMRDIILGNSKA